MMKRRLMTRRYNGDIAGAGGGLLAVADEGTMVVVVAAAAARRDDVPVVLDGVVGAAREEAGDERPAVAVGAVRLQEQLLLRRREGPPVDPRVQLVEPSEPAALAYMFHPCHCHVCINTYASVTQSVAFWTFISEMEKIGCASKKIYCTY